MGAGNYIPRDSDGVIHQLGDRSAQSIEQKLIAQLGQTHDLYRRASTWTSKKIEVD